MKENSPSTSLRWSEKLGRTGLFRAAFVLIVLAYFVRFVGPGLHSGFNTDDPMNIYIAWQPGWGSLLSNLILFFTTSVRPMGGVYFGALYHFFGLNPFPYHVALTGLLLVNAFLSYRFGRLLTGSELAGGLTALVMVYHGRMAELVYLPSFAYDVLCFLFYFLALNCYLTVRTRGARLTRMQTAAFLLLYICALDSKEMAVTLPVIAFLYEAIWHAPGGKSPAHIGRWLRGEALPALLAGLLTLVYVLGKTLGADSLVKLEAYRPVFTWDRYWESTTRFVNAILYEPNAGGFFNSGRVALLAAILLLMAWRTRQKHLWLMWFFIWIAPLPITFIPGRNGPCLYLPLMGWAVIVVTIFLSLCRTAVQSRALRWAPAEIALGLLVTVGIAAFWVKTERDERGVPPGIRHPGQLTWSVIQQVRAAQPRVPPGSQIYVVRGPFEGWDMKFILELLYRDRSVTVWLGEQTPLPPYRIEQMNYIFTFEDGKLNRIKGVP